MSDASDASCSRCGSADARTWISGDLLCDRCADRRIAAHTGFPELPDPPAPFVLRDAAGTKRTFVVRLRRAPTGVVAELEQSADPDSGYRRGVLGTHEADVEHLVFRLREIAEQEVAQRYLEPNPHRAGFLLKGDAFEGRLEWSGDGNEVAAPYDVVVDGKKLSWDDLGRALEPFQGFRIRIEISDTFEDLRGET